MFCHFSYPLKILWFCSDFYYHGNIHWSNAAEKEFYEILKLSSVQRLWTVNILPATDCFLKHLRLECLIQSVLTSLFLWVCLWYFVWNYWVLFMFWDSGVWMFHLCQYSLYQLLIAPATPHLLVQPHPFYTVRPLCSVQCSSVHCWFGATVWYRCVPCAPLYSPTCISLDK